MAHRCVEEKVEAFYEKVRFNKTKIVTFVSNYNSFDYLLAHEAHGPHLSNFDVCLRCSLLHADM